MNNLSPAQYQYGYLKTAACKQTSIQLPGTAHPSNICSRILTQISTMSEDFDVFQSLWSNINDTCAPAPPPGSDAVSCFLMEMPGFSINPKAFDPQSFNELESQEMSPDCAVARLCDRVPAVANYFYDTGNKISFYWNQLCTTYGSTAPEAQSARLKERYDSAIKALYGSQEGYINQEKTKLFQNVETLRSAWEEKQDELAEFKKTCQKDRKKIGREITRKNQAHCVMLLKKHTPSTTSSKWRSSTKRLPYPPMKPEIWTLWCWNNWKVGVKLL